MKVSIERASLALMYDSTSNPLTSPAILQAKFEASNLVMRSMPDWPAKRLAQASPTVLPTGEMQPRPVTRSEEHTSELQSQSNLVCRLLLEQKRRNRISWVGVRQRTISTSTS